MKAINPWRHCLLLCVCAGLVHCDTRRNEPVVASEDNLAHALTLATDTQIIPVVQAFAEQADVLRDSAYDFCTRFTASALEQTQNQWIATNNRWFRLAAYRFGPLNDNLVLPPYIYVDSLRLRGTQYIETVRSEMSEDVLGTQALTQAYFTGKPFQQVGLLALEAALFETVTEPRSQALADITAEYQQHPRKCEVLTQLSELLQERAADFYAGWTIAYGDGEVPYRTLFLQNQLADGTPPLTLLLTSVQEYLNYLRARHVVSNSAPVAGTAWQALEAALDETALLLNGTEPEGIRFFGIMRNAGYGNHVEEVQQNIAFAKTAIAERNATDLEAALSLLDGNFKRQIPEGLDVVLGVNFSDGD